MSNQDNDEVAAHLEDLDDGAGCAEIWEKLSENRNNTDDGEPDAEVVEAPSSD